MKKILIALDNHENYYIISNKGNELAKALGASVALLHVFPDTNTTSPDAFSSLYPSMGTIDVQQSIEMANQLQAESKKFLEQVKEELKNSEADIYTAEGDVADAILDIAKSIAADIIVMGSHSRSGIEKIFMGNVAQKVLKHSHTPLFIVPVK